MTTTGTIREIAKLYTEILFRARIMFPNAEYYPYPDVYRSDHPRDQ